MQNKSRRSNDSGPNKAALHAPAEAAAAVVEPIPVGEVTEGNEDSDWAAWEDSVAFQDSQFPEQDVAEIKNPSPPDPAGAAGGAVDEDPFASVHRNSS